MRPVLSPSDLLELHGGTRVVLRDLVPDDEALYPAFHARVSPQDRRLRFFSPAPLSARQMYRLTHFSPGEAIARAAVGLDDDELYGVSRLHRIDGATGEFAVMVRSDLKGLGLGRRLLEEVIARAPALGISHVIGLILPENAGMLALAAELGFAMRADNEEAGVLRASLDLPTEPRLAA